MAEDPKPDAPAATADSAPGSPSAGDTVDTDATSASGADSGPGAASAKDGSADPGTAGAAQTQMRRAPQRGLLITYGLVFVVFLVTWALNWNGLILPSRGENYSPGDAVPGAGQPGAGSTQSPPAGP